MHIQVPCIGVGSAVALPGVDGKRDPKISRSRDPLAAVLSDR
jgi:hypothetical protein